MAYQDKTQPGKQSMRGVQLEPRNIGRYENGEDVAPPHEPQGPIYVGAIENEASRMYDLLDRLESRLSGILRHPPQQIAGEVRNEHSGQIIDRLSVLQVKFYNLNQCLDALIDRLEF